MKNRILIVDDVHPILMEKLNADVNIEIDYFPNFTKVDAEKVIFEYQGLVIRSKFFVDESFIKKASSLKFIARSGAGMDNIDEVAAEQSDIALISANEGNADAMAEHMMGMLLNLLNHLDRSNYQIKTLNEWNREPNRGHELKGKTIALIGYGHNGQAMAKKLSGFDVNTIAYDKYKTGFSDEFAREVSMEEVVKLADIVSYHIPLTRETKNLVNEEYLRHFRKPIYFLMGARGGIVDIPAVLKAIDDDKIVGAAFDVLPVEKFPALRDTNWFEDLKSRENILLTPHIAGWTFESYFKLSDYLAEKILKLLR